LNTYLHTDYLKLFELSKDHLDFYDEDLYAFLHDWNSNKPNINTFTSGSTGNPKSIKLSKKAILESAIATNHFFNLNERSSFFICLPTKYIAGKMMVIRAIIAKAKIIIAKPEAIPVKKLTTPVSFCAMTPYQVLNCTKENKDQLNLISQLIIGGSPVNNVLCTELTSLKTRCYISFGMTETISHIALKSINKSIYECLPHVSISTNENNQLIIDAPLINVHDMVTNDIISLKDDKHFIWMGRADNIINSGGVKLHPEIIEKKLDNVLFGYHFFIDKVPHTTLGSQPILIIDETANDQLISKSLAILNKYETPKKIYKTDQFYFSGNNKINRSKTKAIAIEKYK